MTSLATPNIVNFVWAICSLVVLTMWSYQIIRLIWVCFYNQRREQFCG